MQKVAVWWADLLPEWRVAIVLISLIIVGIITLGVFVH